MDTLIKKLCNDLTVTGSEYVGDTMELHVEYVPEHISCCPKCGQPSKRRHSAHIRRIKDLPIQEYKVVLVLNVREYFCDNKECPQKIFAEKYDFLCSTGTRTQRLDDYLLNTALDSSAIGTERLVREKIADVSNDSILRIIKKNASDTQ